jgi:hypothetical protein
MGRTGRRQGDRITRWKLRTWLLALVAATMLPCLAVLGWTFAANAKRDQDEARRDACAMATLIAGRAGSWKRSLRVRK